MAGNSFGTIFKITTWGESHGPALGVVIDGCPAGLPLTESDIQPFLDRRKPGQSKITTKRKEADLCEILSGTFEGRTTGTPISILVRNTSQISADYNNLASCYRPGHADFTYDEKYGFRDYRGGGRSSGRETIGRVAAGAVASALLSRLGIHLCAYTASIGPVKINREHFDPAAILTTQTAMPDIDADEQAMAYLGAVAARKDSAGGSIECRITGVPAGIGDPVFEKLDANLAKAVMSIGAVKSVEIGDGCEVSHMMGSQNNDGFKMENGRIRKTSNHAGGILGGISDGSEILLRAHIKPTPSIYRMQETVNKNKEEVHLTIQGRHDPVIVPRAVVVVESMAALVLADALLLNMSSRMEAVSRFYFHNPSN